MSTQSTQKFLDNCPPVGAKKMYLVTCNKKPFAGFDTKEEAKAAKNMYGAEIKLKKGNFAYCSLQEWDVILNPDYNK